MEEELKTIDESIYSLMWKMTLGEKMIVTISAWNDVRAYANQLKNRTGKRYTINRIRTERTKTDYLLIRRTE